MEKSCIVQESVSESESESKSGNENKPSGRDVRLRVRFQSVWKDLKAQRIDRLDYHLNRHFCFTTEYLTKQGFVLHKITIRFKKGLL